MKAIREQIGPSVLFADEPVEEWQEQGLLDRDDKESSDSTLSKQLAILVSLFATFSRTLQQGLEDAANDTHHFIITERSLEANRKVFASATLLTQKSRAMYDHTWNNLMSTTPLADIPQLIVYLYAPVEVLVDRITTRARPEESWIDETYLRLLDAYYETWIHDLPPSQVLRIDATASSPAQIAETIVRCVVRYR
jgi:deoxyadenosine/deoxycytidine kinase